MLCPHDDCKHEWQHDHPWPASLCPCCGRKLSKHAQANAKPGKRPQKPTPAMIAANDLLFRRRGKTSR